MYAFLLMVLFGADVKNLGADEYATREAAEARLTYWCDVCWPLLDKSFSDPEVRRRAQRIKNHIMPLNYSPISFISGSPLIEWQWNHAISVGVRPKDGCWYMSYTKPDSSAFLFSIIKYYGEKARTQYTWKEWHADADGREATRLLTQDMLRVGMPPVLVRCFTDWLNKKEKLLSEREVIVQPRYSPR
jgi:hypothetical protein